jgi:hypothetical protein
MIRLVRRFIRSLIGLLVLRRFIRSLIGHLQDSENSEFSFVITGIEINFQCLLRAHTSRLASDPIIRLDGSEAPIRRRCIVIILAKNQRLLPVWDWRGVPYIGGGLL